MKTLVTGGAGFIGSHLVRRLLSDGHDVRVLDNFSTGRRENLTEVAADVDLVEGDIRSYERVHTAVRGTDVVFHQAALPSVPRSVQDPLTTDACNVTGTLNTLLAARDSDVGRVILASSSSVYGANPDLPKHEGLMPMPLSPYAVGKLTAESYCRSFSSVYGLETVALRYFNVFGPRQDPLSQYAAVIPRFVAAALTDGAPVIFGDGEQTRDFTFIGNVVDANLLAMTATAVSGAALNIACGEQISINQLLRGLEKLTGGSLVGRHEPVRPGEVRHSVADVSRAASCLGYVPKVSFEQGLASTLEHYERRMSAQ